MPPFRRRTLLGAPLGLLVAGPAMAAAGSSSRAGPLKGTLLVAAPSLTDPNFSGTVALMVDHGPDGGFGLVVNRPLGDGPLDKFMAGLGLDPAGAVGNIRLHAGGPVERNHGFVLHTPDYGDDSTRAITTGISISSDPRLLEAVARGRGPSRYLFLFGYAGWAPGQLEAEIARDDWMVAPIDPALVLDPDDAGKWARAARRAGITL